MKYVPLPAFEVVTNALNFDTINLHISGGCELYTTKASAGDRSILKKVDEAMDLKQAQLERQRIALSPADGRKSPSPGFIHAMIASAFGSLAEASNRRTFAYVVATLNSTYPEYDFSTTLTPHDFRRIPTLRDLYNTIDSTLANLRPNATAASYSSSPGFADDTVWNVQHWRIIDDQMALQDCELYAFDPAHSPFEDDDPSIWRYDYLFYNRELKRVCHLYLKGQSMGSVDWSDVDEPMTPYWETPRGKRRSDAADEYETEGKRARYWFGESAEEAENEENERRKIQVSFRRLSDSTESPVKGKAKATPSKAKNDSSKKNGELRKVISVRREETTEDESDEVVFSRENSAVRLPSEQIYDTLEV